MKTAKKKKKKKNVGKIEIDQLNLEQKEIKKI